MKVMPKSYLTPNEVAELLMVSPTAVRQWAEKGDLNALTTPGGHRRFLPGEVERFARKRGLTLNTGTSGALRVLVVDDDVQLTRYLAEYLNGYQDEVVTQTVNDGFAAGLKVREFNPHIVLLDLMMPGINGFQVCRLLKAGPDTKVIRIIAMTGYPSLENVEKIMAVGADACLSKPIDGQMLLKHLGLNQQASA
ncbi:MAG TPA: response regulator [Acidiferrobacteraceae bacterium]|nr:response regulator [Acidiferrobacteraceae bacterium]